MLEPFFSAMSIFLNDSHSLGKGFTRFFSIRFSRSAFIVFQLFGYSDYITRPDEGAQLSPFEVGCYMEPSEGNRF